MVTDFGSSILTALYVKEEAQNSKSEAGPGSPVYKLANHARMRNRASFLALAVVGELGDPYLNWSVQVTPVEARFLAEILQHYYKRPIVDLIDAVNALVPSLRFNYKSEPVFIHNYRLGCELNPVLYLVMAKNGVQEWFEFQRLASDLRAFQGDEKYGSPSVMLIHDNEKMFEIRFAWGE